MGCASSAPLAEQGKNLVEGVKETAHQALNKGEKAIHDTTETVKDGISSGVESVKDTVQLAMKKADDSVSSTAQKLGETFSFSRSKTAEDLASNIEETKDNFSSSKDDVLAETSENVAEAVSEAETVLVSETEHIREAFQTGTTPLFQTVHLLEDDLDNELKDLESMENVIDKTEQREHTLKDNIANMIKNGTEVLEDIENETEDVLGENVTKVEKIMEELKGEDETNKKEEESQESKEELTPTLWEAAADAILMRKTIKNFEPAHFGQERIFFTQEKTDQDFSEKSFKENDLVIENTENE